MWRVSGCGAPVSAGRSSPPAGQVVDDVVNRVWSIPERAGRPVGAWKFQLVPNSTGRPKKRTLAARSTPALPCASLVASAAKYAQSTLTIEPTPLANWSTSVFSEDSKVASSKSRPVASSTAATSAGRT